MQRLIDYFDNYYSNYKYRGWQTDLGNAIYDNYNENVYVQISNVKYYNSAIFVNGTIIYITVLSDSLSSSEHIYSYRASNSSYSDIQYKTESFANDDVNGSGARFLNAHQYTVNGVTFYASNQDGSARYPVSFLQNYIPVFYTAADFYNYITNTAEPPVVYDYESVAEIIGNGHTYTLARINPASINNGEAVTGASSSAFQLLSDASLVKNIIDEVLFEPDKVTVTYTIPSALYDYIKLVYKKGSIPASYSDGTAIDILQSSTSQIVEGLNSGSTYYFVIFTNLGRSEASQIEIPANPIA